MRRLLCVLGVYLAVAALYWPSSVALYSIWHSTVETFQDGDIILLISLWLVWRERLRLASVAPRPVPGALLAIAVLSFAWLWAWRATIQEVHIELLPPLLLMGFVAALGWRSARMLMFPIAYLYFAMPSWSHLGPLLQSLSASANGLLIWIVGLQAYMRGNFIHIPWGILHIEGGCSGLNTLITLLALAAVYGKVTRMSLARRLKWLAVAAALALVVNWVRIFMIIVVAYESKLHSPLVRNHIWFGWLLFILAFLAYLWMAERSNSKVRRVASTEVLRTPPQTTTPPSHAAKPGYLMLTIAVLAILPLTSYAVDWVRPRTDMAVQIKWPTPPPDWSGPQTARPTTWEPRFINAGGQSFAQYTISGQRVQAYAVAYRIQRQSGKLLGYRNTLLADPEDLQALSRRTVTSPSGRWIETVAEAPDGQRSLIWSRYAIGSRTFIRPRLSQIWYGLLALMHPPISSLTALRTVCAPTCRDAEQRLQYASRWLHPTMH